MDNTRASGTWGSRPRTAARMSLARESGSRLVRASTVIPAKATWAAG